MYARMHHFFVGDAALIAAACAVVTHAVVQWAVDHIVRKLTRWAARFAARRFVFG